MSTFVFARDRLFGCMYACVCVYGSVVHVYEKSSENRVKMNKKNIRKIAEKCHH